MRQSLDRMLRVGQAEGSGFLAEVREILEPEIAAMGSKHAAMPRTWLRCASRSG